MEYPYLHLFRPSILALKPYSSARDEFKGKAEAFLDANENPYPRPDGYNRYPDPLQTKLKARISELKSVPVANIFLGNGSDEAIDLLFRATCSPGKDSVVYCTPTYGMYSVSAAINDIHSIEIPLIKETFQPDVDRILNEGEHAKMLFICTPNNPTGNLVEPDIMKKLLSGFKGLVVLDEAYIDFANNASLLPELSRFPNLVILQTLSKAWGLAGLRIGMAFAHEQVIQILNKIKPPYNISGAAQDMALDALLDTRGFHERLLQTLSQRQLVMESLKSMQGVLEIFPSDANFLLVRFKDSGTLFSYLQTKGIVLRDRSKQVPDALRISIGTPLENTGLLQTIQQFYA